MTGFFAKPLKASDLRDILRQYSLIDEDEVHEERKEN
jgi:hypothetical protein